MKNKMYKSATVAFLFFALCACVKNDGSNNGNLPFLGGENPASNPTIDEWVRTNLNKPFNIEVKYRYDQYEAALGSTLVPVLESKVLPSLKDIKTVWIDPYVKIAGEKFFKTYVPKLITLVGSPSFNSNGSITLGVAEGGLKILLYDMNRYNPAADRDMFINKMHTIHHEFAHILHQNKLYSTMYQTISAGGYTGNWSLSTMDEANNLGFVTPYSRSNADEDFVETIATMLANGKDYFESLKRKLVLRNNTVAADKLTRKEQIIVDYYKEKWSINFYDLQEAVRLAIETISNPEIMLNSVYGNRKFFSTFKADSVIIKTQSSGSALDSVMKSIDALSNRFNIRFDELQLTFTHSDTILLRTKTGPKADLNAFYLADYRFKITTAANGDITFGSVIINAGRDGYWGLNANLLKNQFAPITNYLSGNVQRPKWKPGYPIKPISSNLQYASWVAASDPGSLIMGVLTQ